MGFDAGGVRRGNVEFSLSVSRTRQSDSRFVSGYAFIPGATGPIPTLSEVWRELGPPDCSPVQMLGAVQTINLSLPRMPPEYGSYSDSFFVAPANIPAPIRDIVPPMPRFTNYRGVYPDAETFTVLTGGEPPPPPNEDGHIEEIPLLVLELSDGPAGFNRRIFKQRFLYSLVNVEVAEALTFWTFTRTRLPDIWGEPVADTTRSSYGFSLLATGGYTLDLYGEATIDGLVWVGDFPLEISFLFAELNTPACAAGGVRVNVGLGFGAGPFPDQTGPINRLVTPFDDSPMALCNYTLPITGFLK